MAGTSTGASLSRDLLDVLGNCWAIAESSPMPMAALEGDSHIVRYVNSAFCQLTGRTRAELIGEPFLDFSPDSGACLSLLERVCRTGLAEIHNSEEKDGTGNPLYRSYASWPLFASNKAIAVLMFQVTEPSPFHEQASAVSEALMLSCIRQHEIADEAESMNLQLRRANEGLKEFAFAASHDLQEPLRTIALYSQMLITGYREGFDGDEEFWVKNITDGTKRMHDLLADLRSYAEAGIDNKGANELVDLNSTFATVKQLLKAAIDESSASVTSDHLPSVIGRETHFTQLLQNLVGNAIKYRGKQTPRIHVSAERVKDAWRVAVADNGMGIAQEHHHLVFGVFKRLHGKSIPGTGIGLAICQRVVDLYHGRIWIESQAGEGATFYFTLPLLAGR